MTVSVAQQAGVHSQGGAATLGALSSSTSLLWLTLLNYIHCVQTKSHLSDYTHI